MESSDNTPRITGPLRPAETPQTQPIIADAGPRSHALASHFPSQPYPGRISSVFVFNPFAEGYVARGPAFTPVKHQARLAEDLANLPQFLCEPDDIVLLAKRPSADFLNYLQQAGFRTPEFVELRAGHIDPVDNLCQRQLGGLRPWAWGPDSVKLLAPLFAHAAGKFRPTNPYFNEDIARLYSKAWSADLLRKVLARWRGEQGISSAVRESLGRVGDTDRWLCTAQEVGVSVDNFKDCLEAIATIRARGHHRVVVKEALGLAGHNAIRLWEPEILPAQRRWLARALEDGRRLVVEPWLERELDFSVQLEMGPRNLKLCGYTGLVNDRKGQFLANWAEAEYSQCLPAKVAALFPAEADISERIQRLYGQIFSLIEAELQSVGLVGPISIDAIIYRTPQGECRLKPVVEINPRYTMGRLTVELMKHACPGSCGVFRLVSQAQARAEGFTDFSSYASSLGERFPLSLTDAPSPKIRQGALCLNDPGQAQVCLATFAVSPILNLPDLLSGKEPQSSL